MNDHNRANLLCLCERLHTWRSRTGKSIAEFIKTNRNDLDELTTPITRRPKQRWRHWEELRPVEIIRIKKHIRRRHKYTISLLARFKIIQTKSSVSKIAQLLNASTTTRYTHLGFDHPVGNLRTNEKKYLHGTPADRIKARRIKYLVDQIKRRTACDCKIVATFIPNLHPDDVELVELVLDDGTILLNITADRQVMQLGIPLNGYPILAKQLYLSDEDINAEVYYCATIAAVNSKTNKTKVLSLERKYIARVKSINGEWLITNKFTKAKDALQSAAKLYAISFAERLNPNQE